jgi:hypothetical protein
MIVSNNLKWLLIDERSYLVLGLKIKNGGVAIAQMLQESNKNSIVTL